MLNPGNHVCRQHGENASSFIHSRDGVVIGRKYAELRSLLETQVGVCLDFLEFFKERSDLSSQYSVCACGRLLGCGQLPKIGHFEKKIEFPKN